MGKEPFSVCHEISNRFGSAADQQFGAVFPALAAAFPRLLRMSFFLRLPHSCVSHS
jgi:hypothetical protein